MNAKITCREEWTDEMKSRFGEENTVVELPDSSEGLLKLLLLSDNVTRVQIVATKDGIWELCYHLDYD